MRQIDFNPEALLPVGRIKYYEQWATKERDAVRELIAQHGASMPLSHRLEVADGFLALIRHIHEVEKLAPMEIVRWKRNAATDDAPGGSAQP